MSEENTDWSEETSRFFIEYARYFVPDRDSQIKMLAGLVPDPGKPFYVLELACGEGLLAQAVLDRFKNCTLEGLDGSHEMLAAARLRLKGYGERFQPGKFDLPSDNWRHPLHAYQAVISSLAIHHLKGAEKARLFKDIYRILEPGGVLLIADIILPSDLGMDLAASAYDEAVRRQALELDGSLQAFDRFNHEKWNFFRYPDDPLDQPSTLFDQLKWLEEAGFKEVDVFWLRAGHALFGGRKET